MRGVMKRAAAIRVGLIADDSGLKLTPEMARLVAGALSSVERMINDTELKKKVDAQYYAGRVADLTGFDWYPTQD